MKKIFRKEVLVGTLVILAMVILFFGINFLKGINLFKAANYYYASYTNVEGLAISAPVTLNGYKIGLVREIQYQYNKPGNVLVEISVDKSLRLPKGSKAAITSDILGTATVALSLGNAHDGYYNVGDTIEGTVAAGLMASVSDNLMPSVNAIVPKIDTLLTSLNTIVSNPSLANAINRFDDITLQLNASLVSLKGVMAQLNPIVGDVKDITGNVDSITGDLAVASAALKEAPIDSILMDLQATVTNLHILTEQLNDPNSSVGKLTHDPALYDNINSAVASLDSLFVDIKKNPKRYINIKVF